MAEQELTETSRREARKQRRASTAQPDVPTIAAPDAAPAKEQPPASPEAGEESPSDRRQRRRRQSQAAAESPVITADPAAGTSADAAESPEGDASTRREGRNRRRQLESQFGEAAEDSGAGVGIDPSDDSPLKAAATEPPRTASGRTVPRKLLGEMPAEDELYDPSAAASSPNSRPGALLPPLGASFAQSADGRFRLAPMVAGAAAPTVDAAARTREKAIQISSSRTGVALSGGGRSGGGGGGGRGGGGAGGGGGGGRGADDEDEDEDAGWQPPADCNAIVASALMSWVLAPALLSQGLLAGLAAYEMLAANADITEPPNARVLYARASTSFWRSHVGLGLASLIGGVVRAMPRWRSGQYTVQPWRRLLDRLNILIYFAVVMLSFAVRQLAWAMDSPVTVERLPWYDPVSAPYFEAHFEPWRVDGSAIYVTRAFLAGLGLLIATLPTGDHRFVVERAGHWPRRAQAQTGPFGRLPSRRRLVSPEDAALGATGTTTRAGGAGGGGGGMMGGGGYTPHGGHVMVGSDAGLHRAGLAYAVAFWRIGQVTRRRPTGAPLFPRAPDGGPPLVAVPELSPYSRLPNVAQPSPLEEGMDRRQYTRRLLRIVIWLSLDLLALMVADTVHWLKHFELFSGGYLDIVVLDALVLVVTLVARAVVNITFFTMCVGTQTYKLGRIDALWKRFGRLILLQFGCFCHGVMIRGHRIARDFMKETSGDKEVFFWHDADTSRQYDLGVYSKDDIGPNGTIYAMNVAVGFCVMLPYYILTLDAARRLGRSEYYLHPVRDAAKRNVHDRQRDRRARIG